MHTIDLTLFVACYNERDNIVSTLEIVVDACTECAISYEILVVDDGSNDGSPEIVRRFMQENPLVPLRMIVNEFNEGLAFNYVEAAFQGTGKWFRLVCGDNVEPKETLLAVFRRIGEAELLITYRPNDIAGRSWFRKLLSRSFTSLVNFISGHRIQYYNGLPLTTRYNVMRWHSNSHGFGFQADMITRLLDRGTGYIEIPVQGNERASGNSKALTFRNFCSVTHSLATILMRRFSKIIYGRS